jgi:ferric-dicitrate binding protein FerR (iron transport regulator)
MKKINSFVKKVFLGLYDPLEANDLLSDNRSKEILQNEWDLSENQKSEGGFDISQEFSKLKYNISFETNTNNKKVKFSVYRKKLLKIAASILIPVLFASISYYAYEYYMDNSPENIVMYKSAKGQRSFYTLADGTKVWLNSNSSLKLNKKGYNKTKREVELEGEAFFDVTKSEKSFIVKSGNFEVKVHGTSFNVNAYPDNELIEATLVTGKVAIEISSKYNKQSQILVPGQKASFYKTEEALVVNYVNTAYYTDWVEGKLSFDNQYLDKVIDGLSKHFNIKISLAPELKQKYRYTLTIKDESINEVLDLLKITSSIDYKKQKDGFVIFEKKIK